MEAGDTGWGGGFNRGKVLELPHNHRFCSTMFSVSVKLVWGFDGENLNTLHIKFGTQKEVNGWAERTRVVLHITGQSA